ncbi:MAG: hypothetical protein Ta2B_03370 [Termitinemataceae bacterium]|nr:MAG: hypothetical protein Ta2B_03370 [Termitinemataceae bacterium]
MKKNEITINTFAFCANIILGVQFLVVALLLIPSVRSLVVSFGEYLVDRPLNVPIWHERMISWSKVCIMILAPLFLIFLLLANLKIKKVPKKLICIAAIISGSVLICIPVVIRLSQNKTIPIAPILVFLFSVISITGIALYVFIYYQKLNIEKIFFMFFTVIGLSYLFIIPMSGVPDEFAHWLRILDIKEGHIIAGSSIEEKYGGDMLSGNALFYFDVLNGKYSDLGKNNTFNLDKENKIWYHFPNTALYSPISYIFQMPCVIIFSIFTDSTLLLMYAGRISAFLFSLLVLFACIKRLPVHKILFFCIAMMPMFIHQSISLSADASLNSVSLAASAFIIAVLFNPTARISKKQVIVCFCLAICISLSKIIYLPFVFLFCLIPITKFESRKQYLLFCISIIILSVLLNLGWSVFVSSKYKIDLGYEANMNEQLKFIFSNPLGFCKIILKSWVSQFSGYILTCLGSSLGWLSIRINAMILSIYSMVAIMLVFFEKDTNLNITFKKRSVLFLITLSILCLLTANVYLTWTTVGSNQLSGIQGRYFIPSIMILLIAIVYSVPFCIKEIQIAGRKLSRSSAFKYFLPFICVMHLYALQKILLYYI